MSKKRFIRGNWVTHTYLMRSSPAWRALPDTARRALDRLEVEHMRKGGTMNGHLVCTYDHFHEWGIRRASIALALRQCEALGFLEKTRTGRRTAGGVRVPSTYRLTYVWSRHVAGQVTPLPTDEWEQMLSPEQAAAALKSAADGKRYDNQPSGKSRASTSSPKETHPGI